MLAGYEFGACLGMFGDCRDRFCQNGYGAGAITIEEMIARWN